MPVSYHPRSFAKKKKPISEFMGALCKHCDSFLSAEYITCSEILSSTRMKGYRIDLHCFY